MYKLFKDIFTGNITQVYKFETPVMIIPFAPGNTEYDLFKKLINADEAQLQDSDGNLMSAADAKAFVATLP